LVEHLKLGHTEVQHSPYLRAQLEMVRGASISFLDRVWQQSFAQLEEWLAPPNRATIRIITNSFLSALEHNLAALDFHIIPASSESLLPAAATAYTAVCFSGDLFPSLRAQMTQGGLFPTCGRLVEAVEQRVRIKEWFEKEHVKQKPWTVASKWGGMAWIQDQAGKYD